LCLLNSRFKAETVVKVGNIFVDSLQADTKGNMELSALDLFVKLPCILDGDVTTNQIQLIDSSLLKRVDHLLSSALGSSQPKEAPSLMVNPFNCTRSEIQQLVVIVASPTELNARHLVYFVDFCKQNNQLSDDVVDAWCGSSQTYDVCSDIARIEVLGGSGPCLHELFLGFDALSGSEDAVLDHELSRLN
jgi:hypothetical protein